MEDAVDWRERCNLLAVCEIRTPGRHTLDRIKTRELAPRIRMQANVDGENAMPDLREVRG
jgi:hypothetical protein